MLRLADVIDSGRPAWHCHACDLTAFAPSCPSCGLNGEPQKAKDLREQVVDDAVREVGWVGVRGN